MALKIKAVSDYIEIEDPKELGRLYEVLSAKLTKKFKKAEDRIIGWPAGNFSGKVHFLSTRGDNVFWWESRISNDKAVNLFGHGTPGDNAMLNIDVQFNIPVVKFSRRSGGAFLKHAKTGKIVLAHRGIVTLGHGRIKKSDLFSELVATLREADTSSGTSKFLLIAELDSPTLVGDIETFSSELRRTVKALGNKKQSRQTALRKALSDYFDEFSGKQAVKGRRKGIADCYHGIVVRALRDKLSDNSEIFKTLEIDLIVLKKSKAFIFEVKTSSDNQSIYTAVGQLTIHAPVVAKNIGRRALQRVIVLPDKPTKHLRNILEKRLGIRILTFSRSAKGLITVNGLDKLK